MEHSLTYIYTIISLVAAPLGVGTALDALPKRMRRWTFERVHGALGQIADTFFSGSRFLDRIFGSRLLSWRALGISASLSLLSITFSAIIAYLTSDNLFGSNAVPFGHHPRTEDIAIFVIFVLLVVVFDYFAYTQTRIFVRAMDNFRSRTISAILVISDLFVSISSFVIGYSVARLFSILFFIGFHGAHIDPYVRVFSPELVSSMDDTISTRYNSSKDSPAIRREFDRLRVEFDRNPNVSSAKNLVEYTDNLNGWSAKPRKGVYTSVKTGCAPNATWLVAFPDDTPNINYFRYSYGILHQLHPDTKLLDLVPLHVLIEPARRQSKLGLRCHFRYISASTRINLREIASTVPLYDYFLNSSLITAQSLIMTTLEKFAYFETEDPSSEPYTFLQQSVKISELTFLGIGGARVDSIPSAIAQGEAMPEDRVRIPFAALASSCLTSTLLFLGYIIFVGSLWCLKTLATHFSFLQIKSDRRIFTKLSIGMSAVMLGIYILSISFDLIGHLFVSLALLKLSL